jgi:hypothetical protein
LQSSTRLGKTKYKATAKTTVHKPSIKKILPINRISGRGMNGTYHLQEARPPAPSM